MKRKPGRPPRGPARTMAGDLLAALSQALEEHSRREAARVVAMERVDVRDARAAGLVRRLRARALDAHVHAIARDLGVPVEMVRDAIAMAVARGRVREKEARAAVLEVAS